MCTFSNLGSKMSFGSQNQVAKSHPQPVVVSRKYLTLPDVLYDNWDILFPSNEIEYPLLILTVVTCVPVNIPVPIDDGDEVPR